MSLLVRLVRRRCTRLVWRRTPGIAFEYGSVHLQIAGLMAIKAAQIDLWVDLFDKIITKPLNLGKVSWWPSNENPILGGGTINRAY
jgi:hypothetical protein